MRLGRLLLLLVVAAAVAISAESLAWLLAARQIQAGFREWTAASRAEGWRITDGAEHLGGWPLAATLRVAPFSISGGENVLPGGLSWQSPQLVLRVGLQAPRSLVVVPSGEQRIRIFGSPAIVLAASAIRAVTRFSAWSFFAKRAAPETVTISATGVHAGPAALDPRLVSARTLTIEGELSVAATDQRHRRSLALQASGITLAHEQLAALGPRIEDFSLAGALVGRMPAGASWPSRLAAWRNSGGMVAIRGLSLVWGPLAIGGAGSFVLDQKLQPAGQGTLRVVGYAATLDALVAAGKIDGGAATAAKAILMLMAQPTAPGHPPEVDIPFRVEDSTASVGRIPVLRLPEVSWPPGT